MADGQLLTSIAFQGGGALGAYATGALNYIYEAQPAFRPTCVSGVSIGALPCRLPWMAARSKPFTRTAF